MITLCAGIGAFHKLMIANDLRLQLFWARERAATVPFLQGPRQ
jgi:hypothetical protein